LFRSAVSSARRKQRKAHFSSDSTSRAKMMSAQLSSELRKKHNVRFKQNIPFVLSAMSQSIFNRFDPQFLDRNRNSVLIFVFLYATGPLCPDPQG
jgi:hypothetical protein